MEPTINELAKTAVEAASNTVSIVQDIPEKFVASLDIVKDISERISRTDEQSIHNNKGSVSVKKDGQINLASGLDSQIKLGPNGTIETISLAASIKSNNTKIDTDDLIINNHKFNRKLFDLADFKQVLKTEYSTDTKIVGNLTMMGTVLTRAWDSQLKRYVLIRRLVNIPMFSPSLGATDVAPGLQLVPSTERIKEMQSEFQKLGSDIDSYISKISTIGNKKTNATQQNATTITDKKQPQSMTKILTNQSVG